jgi:hypothetical protein
LQTGSFWKVHFLLSELSTFLNGFFSIFISGPSAASAAELSSAEPTSGPKNPHTFASRYRSNKILHLTSLPHLLNSCIVASWSNICTTRT